MQAIPWALHCVGCQEQVEGDLRKFSNVDSDFDDAEALQDE
jgi:RNA polymerase-binding transcription factor DksA